MNPDSTYLGDGLYAHDEGGMITLATERENGTNFVCLEDYVLTSFIRFIEKSRDVKITITPNHVAPEGENP